jgi:hypothetical protein
MRSLVDEIEEAVKKASTPLFGLCGRDDFMLHPPPRAPNFTHSLHPLVAVRCLLDIVPTKRSNPNQSNHRKRRANGSGNSKASRWNGYTLTCDFHMSHFEAGGWTTPPKHFTAFHLRKRKTTATNEKFGAARSRRRARHQPRRREGTVDGEHAARQSLVCEDLTPDQVQITNCTLHFCLPHKPEGIPMGLDPESYYVYAGSDGISSVASNARCRDPPMSLSRRAICDAR